MIFIMHPTDLKDLIDCIKIEVSGDCLCKKYVTKYKLKQEVLNNDYVIEAIKNHFLELEYEQAYIEDDKLILDLSKSTG